MLWSIPTVNTTVCFPLSLTTETSWQGLQKYVYATMPAKDVSSLLNLSYLVGQHFWREQRKEWHKRLANTHLQRNCVSVTHLSHFSSFSLQKCFISHFLTKLLNCSTLITLSLLFPFNVNHTVDSAPAHVNMLNKCWIILVNRECRMLSALLSLS